MRPTSNHTVAPTDTLAVRLPSRLAAEFAGTAALLFAIVGSSHSAGRLTDDAGLQLAIAAAVTGVVLAAAIAVFQSLSGSHFNPSVTIAQAFDGQMKGRHVWPYVAAQLAGALVGAGAASIVFGMVPFDLSDIGRDGGGFVLGELLVTAGLAGIIAGLVRAGRTAWVAPAVGGYVAAAHFMTPSTGFANPAVTVARMFAAGPSGIAPASAVWFVIAQVGAGLIVGVAARNVARR